MQFLLSTPHKYEILTLKNVQTGLLASLSISLHDVACLGSENNGITSAHCGLETADRHGKELP